MRRADAKIGAEAEACVIMFGRRDSTNGRLPPLLIVVLAIAALCWSCAGTSSSASATPTASAAASSEMASPSVRSPSNAASASPGGSPPSATSPTPSASPSEARATAAPQRQTAAPTAQPDIAVRFLTSVPTKHWGDPAFKVQAQASNKARLAYAAAGPCSVGRSDGLVAIKAVGRCTITASTSSGPAANASLGFAIDRAHPTIQFKSQSVRFERPFAYELAASVKPAIPLAYAIFDAGQYGECEITDGRLTLRGVEPGLTANCGVEVSAARTSDQYVAPKPVRATIKVDMPNWNVDAISPDTVQFDPANPTVTVTVRETSGSALGIDIEGSSECQYVSTSPSPPSPPKTTTYRIVLSLSPPPPEGYTCEMRATGSPPDWIDSNLKYADNFTVKVVP